MIDPRTGICDWAEQLPGPPDKVYSEPNQMLGSVQHSMAGWGYGGIHGRMMSDAREPSDPSRYTAVAAASWPFSNMSDGTFIQHYPPWAACWTSGNRKANTTLVAVENEGRGGVLSDAQVRNLLRWHKDLEQLTGRPMVRDARNRTIWEHREVWNWSQPNAGPTACPEERLAPFYAALQGAPMFTEAEIRAMAQEEAGRTFLLYLTQVLGLKESTFSDRATVAAIRAHLRTAQDGDQQPPNIRALQLFGEAFDTLADGAVVASARVQEAIAALTGVPE
jgi:hypothetical protein